MKTYFKIATALTIILSLSSCKFIGFNSKSAERSSIKNLITVDFDDEDMIQISDTTLAFNSIECRGGVEIQLVKADKHKVLVSMHKSQKDMFKMYVQGEELVIDASDKSFNSRNQKGIKVIIAAPVVYGIHAKGAIDFETLGLVVNGDFGIRTDGASEIDIKGLKADNVYIETNGAGDVEISDLKTGKITLRSSGASSAEISGVADRAEINLSGAGEVDVKNLVCSDIQTSKHGLGRIRK